MPENNTDATVTCEKKDALSVQCRKIFLHVALLRHCVWLMLWLCYFQAGFFRLSDVGLRDVASLKSFMTKPSVKACAKIIHLL